MTGPLRLAFVVESGTDVRLADELSARFRLTVLARRMGPDRLWLWILLGGLLAPGMILGLGAGAYFTHAPGILGYIFGGPVYLFEVWWLGIPIGIVTAFTCYQMYPWGFKRA